MLREPPEGLGRSAGGAFQAGASLAHSKGFSRRLQLSWKDALGAGTSAPSCIAFNALPRREPFVAATDGTSEPDLLEPSAPRNPLSQLAISAIESTFWASRLQHKVQGLMRGNQCCCSSVKQQTTSRGMTDIFRNARRNIVEKGPNRNLTSIAGSLS